MIAPRLGGRTRVTTHGPSGRPVTKHWCQPLPYSRPGTLTDQCGYCGAPLARTDDRADWHYGEAREQMVLSL